MTLPPPPPRKPDRHYDFRTTNVVFAFSALALLAVTLAMVLMDYGRPWKRFQAEFRDLERQQLLTELEAERTAIGEERMGVVRQEIDAEQLRLEERREEIEEIEGDIATFERGVFESDLLMRARKSELDAAKYQYDVALQDGGERGIERARERIDSLTSEWMNYQRVVQEFEGQQSEAEDRLAEERSVLAASESRLSDLESAMTDLETQLKTVGKNIDYFMLNAPLMDFLAPSLTIEQVVLPGLYHDINFAKIDRVDRCVTCHVASGRAGFEEEGGWQQPFQSHPRLDLFVSDASPHPYGQFGCTACHAGLDRATDFARAGHTPVSDEQLHHWEDEYGWYPQKFLEMPIRPVNLIEAGCLACHSDEVWTPGSTTQDQGRQLIGKMGCSGCHSIGYAAFEDLAKVGPDLTKVASKIEPGWASKWIEAPRDFRPTTWMPHFFYQHNIKGEANLARQRVEIEAVVDFLFAESAEVEYAAVPAGSAASGEALFLSVGCTGCHIRDAEATRDDYFGKLQRLHGPNLVGLGSKVSAEWLFAWLKDPKQYRPDTPMPNLRLTDSEAADLAAFLMQSRRPEFEDLPRQAVDAEMRVELVQGYLRNNMTIAQSAARVDEMSAEELSIYLGRQTVAKYGCFGCHNIKGFEDTKPIGVELTREASKPIHLFDFGHRHDVPHTHTDWLRAKLTQPRGFDEGKELVLNYDELARMPHFGMSEREVNAVLSNILGFAKESVLEDRKAGRGERGEKLAAGRRIVTRYNCQGCHLIEGSGHAIREALVDENNLPPNLAAQGARTQADWLFSFLKDPASVRMRPWLEARMPTFEFSDQEANDLVAYFATLDHTQPFASDPEPALARSLVVGEQIFNMLQCAKCHPAGEDAIESAGGAIGELAPSLLLATDRLRHDWLAPWIKDPQSWIPGTKMPTNFPMAPDGTFSSPLGMAINQATFSAEKARMMRHFSSEQGLDEFLSDVDSVTISLRDYIWTLSN